MPRSPNIQDASILLLRYECAIRSLPFAVLTDRRLGIVSMGRTDMLLLEEILHTTWDVQNSFCQYWDIPTPSKGCEMLPKECQFTILQGLIGTPLKVLVPINWWSPDYWAINSRMGIFELISYFPSSEMWWSSLYFSPQNPRVSCSATTEFTKITTVTMWGPSRVLKGYSVLVPGKKSVPVPQVTRFFPTLGALCSQKHPKNSKKTV